MATYRYQGNIDTSQRYTQISLQLDNGQTALLELGKTYDLTTGEYARASAYIVLVASSDPPVAPFTQIEFPVIGALADGNVPAWNSAVGAFVPTTVLGGGSGGGGGGGGSGGGSTSTGLSTVDTGVPGTLPTGAEYFAKDDTNTVVAIYIGTGNGAVTKVADLSPLVIPYTGTLPDTMDLIEPTLAVNTDTGAMSLLFGGSWLQVGGAGTQIKTYTWLLNGTGTSGDMVVNDTARAWFPPTAGTILGVQASAEIEPDGQPLLVDFRINGTTAFPTTDLPQVPVALLSGDDGVGPTAVPDITTFALGDRLQPFVTQVGVQPGGAPRRIALDSVTAPTGTSWSAPRHPSAITGDLQFYFVRINPGTTTISYTSGPGNAWTLLNSGGTQEGPAGTPRVWIFYRIDDGNAGPWTFTLTSGLVTSVASRLLVRGNAASSPIDSTAIAADSTFNSNGTPGALTTTTTNTLEIFFERVSASTTAAGAAAAGYTNLSGFDSGVSNFTFWGFRVDAASGAQTTPTITFGSSVNGMYARIAVKGTTPPVSWNKGRGVNVTVRYMES